jgi:uncharacterized membrane protein YphA (DoxX/SURF4 family)
MTLEPFDSSPAQPWIRVLGIAAAALLGLVLLVAAWGKALDPVSFVEQIGVEGVDFFGLAELTAFIALGVEIALGLALVLGLRRWWVLLPAAALVAFFLFLTGRAYWRFEHGLIDETEACGCFGNLLDRTPKEAFWQDLWILGLPLGLSLLGRKGTETAVPKWRLVVIGGLTAAVLLFAWKAPDLPLDDLATRLRPGVVVSEICAGSDENPEQLCLDALVSDLDKGRNWVILSDLDEPSFLEAVPQLGGWAASQSEVSLWVLTAASSEAVSTFQWTQAPAFPVLEAPYAMLRPLYRRLPRSFLVEDGEVIDTVSDLPPMEF